MFARKKIFVIVVVVVFWLLATGGSAWKLWDFFNQTKEPDIEEVQASIVKLDESQLQSVIERIPQ